MEIFAKVSDESNPFHRPLLLLKNIDGKVSFSFDGKTSICEHEYDVKTTLNHLQQRKLASDSICNKCNSNEKLLIGKLFEMNMETSSSEVAKSTHSFKVFKTDDYTYTKELFIFFNEPMDKEKKPYYKPDGPKEWYNTHIRAVQTKMKESNEEFLDENSNGDIFLYGHYIVSIRENPAKNAPIIGAIGIRIYYSKKARVYVTGTSSLNSVELSQERMILYNQIISISFDNNYTVPSKDTPNLPIMATCLSHLFAKCWIDYEIDVLNLDRFEDITNIGTLFFLRTLQIAFDLYENPFFPVYLNVIYQKQQQQQRGRRSTKKKTDNSLKRVLLFDSKNGKNAKIEEEFNTILSKGGNPKFEIYQEVRSSKISYNKEDGKSQEQYAIDAENMKLKFISFKVGDIIKAAYKVRPAILSRSSQLTFDNLYPVFYTYILIRLREFDPNFTIDEFLFKDQFSDLFSDRSGYDRAYLQENAYMFFMLQNTSDDEYKVIGKISGICDEYQNSFDHNYFRVLAKGTGYCRIMSYFCFLDLKIMYPEMQKLKIDNIVGPIGMRCYIPAAFDCGFNVKYIDPLTNELKILDKDDNYNSLTRVLVDSPEYTFEIPGRESVEEDSSKAMKINQNIEGLFDKNDRDEKLFKKYGIPATNYGIDKKFFFSDGKKAYFDHCNWVKILTYKEKIEYYNKKTGKWKKILSEEDANSNEWKPFPKAIVEDNKNAYPYWRYFIKIKNGNKWPEDWLYSYTADCISVIKNNNICFTRDDCKPSSEMIENEKVLEGKLEWHNFYKGKHPNIYNPLITTSVNNNSIEFSSDEEDDDDNSDEHQFIDGKDSKGVDVAKEDEKLFKQYNVPASNYGIKKKFIEGHNEEICTWVKLQTADGIQYFVKMVETRGRLFNKIESWTDWRIYHSNCIILLLPKNNLLHDTTQKCFSQGSITQEQLIPYLEGSGKGQVKNKLISFDLPYDAAKILFAQLDFNGLLSTMKTDKQSREQVFMFIMDTNSQEPLYKLLIESQQIDKYSSLSEFWERADSDILDLFDAIFARIVFLAKKVFLAKTPVEISRSKLAFVKLHEYKYYFFDSETDQKNNDDRTYMEIYTQNAIIKNFIWIFRPEEQYNQGIPYDKVKSDYYYIMNKMTESIRAFYDGKIHTYYRKDIEKHSIAKCIRTLWDCDKVIIPQLSVPIENLLIKLFQLLYKKNKIYANPFSEKHRTYTEETIKECMWLFSRDSRKRVLKFFKDALFYKSENFKSDLGPPDEYSWILDVSLKELETLYNKVEKILFSLVNRW